MFLNYGGFMKKLLIVGISVLLIMACDLGVDAPPKTGFNETEGTVTLYIAGAIYNNDYRAPFDGIAWFPGPAALAGWKMGMSSSVAGGAPGTTSTRSWEWRLDEDDSIGQGAAISLLDPIPAGPYSKLTFYARILAGGKPSVKPAVIFELLVDRQGATYGSNANILGSSTAVSVEITDDGDWHQYEIPFRTAPNQITVQTPTGDRPIPDPYDRHWLMPGDNIVSWTVQVPGEAGRIYVDAIKLVP